MKKIIALLLVLTMIFSFGACKGKEKNPADLGFGDDVTQSNENGENASSEDDGNVGVENKDNIMISLPEGYTLVRFAWKLEENGICSADDFIEEAQNGDYSSFPLVSEEPDDGNICFKLEGYLYPCTIEIDKKNDTPRTIIEKLLEVSESYITEEMRQKAKAMGYSWHEILTVASIIEKEAFLDDQRANIASVLYNRLDEGMQIQCDVTINYVTGVIEEIYPEKVDTLKYFYNTYRCAALPAGPICNPSIESIKAALNPPNTDYLFFAIQTEEPYDALFAATYEEHLENCKTLGIN
ncbi:MAG: endolytic transglycosylase MltG [Ruminococcaceae bacterium]|nr:endolytic transglycosylase MltG [Oscillospiraceae bacterium]